MYAHYCSNKTVTICDNNRGIGGKTFKVAGKREARHLAQEYGAQCWNF